MIRLTVLALSLVASTAGRALAQEAAMPPLAEIARQAEAAKATTKKAKKTYTNSDLGKDPRGEPAPPAASTGFVSNSPGKPVPAQEMVQRSEAKVESDKIAEESEDAWRGRADAIRKQVAQMRARLTELTTPNKLTAESPGLQAMINNDLKNVRAALDRLRNQWTKLESSARERKIPLSWIEPQPAFEQ